MTGWTTQILPSLEALGIWGYWIVGVASLLEGFFVTGVIVPGTLVVDAGGALVRLGTLDFFDLVWFVAIGAALGGELSYRLGLHMGRRLGGRWTPANSSTFRRAEDLFRRRGGLALVVGRLMGPVAGFVSLTAALSGMEPRRFRIWNIVGAVVYAFVHVAIGAAAGDLLGRLGPQVTRAALLVAVIAGLLGLIWLISAQIRRGLPFFISHGRILKDLVLSTPRVVRWRERHPGSSAFMARRLDPGRFDGLTLTVLGTIFLYVAVAWIDTVFDFVSMPEVAATDRRVAELVHAFWSPGMLRFFGLVTQLGHWTVILTVLIGALAALALLRRWTSAVQLLVALGGDILTVRLLKGAFGRDRPDLSYFTETSGSFPSGHAALSIAFWGTLMLVLWREKVIGPTTALVAATTIAFLVGVSRLYLIEHFLSDVVNGWLLGGLWLLVGLTLAEWMRSRSAPPAKAGQGAVIGAGAIALATAIAAGWLIWTADPPLAVTEAGPPATILDPRAAAGTADLPLTTETLTGEPVAPVSLIVTAPDLAAAIRPWTDAGWTETDQSPLLALPRLAVAEWTGRPKPETPLLPVFWQSRPQAAGLRSPDGTIELRLWQAEARTEAGSAIFTVALSPALDSGPDWPVGAARVTAVAQIPPDATIAVAPPESGTALNGRRWSWDGKVSFLSQ